LKAGAKGVTCGSAIVDLVNRGAVVAGFVKLLNLATRARLAYEMN
jgi:tryptophan synthase alpha subunit